MNKSYWDEFYKTKIGIGFPSSFAKAVLNEHRDVQTIIDLGAGNGRDSIYFAKHLSTVIYVDQINGIGNCELENILFIIGELEKIETWEKIRKVSENKSSKMFYARFLVHSLDEFELKSFINFVSKIASKTDRLVLEYRVTDKEVKLEFNNHERKYYEPDYIAQQFIRLNWTLNKQEVAKGLAKYREEDPLICRQLLSKKES